MIGDSLHTDIAGAAKLGIWTIWINHHGWPVDPSVPAPDLIVASPAEAAAALERATHPRSRRIGAAHVNRAESGDDHEATAFAQPLLLARHSVPQVSDEADYRQWPLSDEGEVLTARAADYVAGFKPTRVVTSDERKAVQDGADHREASRREHKSRARVPRARSRRRRLAGHRATRPRVAALLREADRAGVRQRNRGRGAQAIRCRPPPLSRGAYWPGRCRHPRNRDVALPRAG